MSTAKQKEYVYEGVQDPYVELVLTFLKSGTVLDLGSGSGRDALYLAHNGFKVTAVDNDAVHIASLRKRTTENNVSVKVIKANIESFVPDHKYDVVISDMVLHFFDQITIKCMLEKMQSWTAHGGLNVVIAYSDKNPVGKRPYLFAHNELSKYYGGWNILKYEERPTEWFKLPGETDLRRNHAVYLIAQMQ